MQFPADDEVTTFYALALLSGAEPPTTTPFAREMRAGALAMEVVKRNPNHPGATHYIIHAFDDPVHAPLGLDAAKAYAQDRPGGVARGPHADPHLHPARDVERGGRPNVRAFNIANVLSQPGDTPSDMAHSGDWGQYGFLQLGDYAGARERIQHFRDSARGDDEPNARPGPWTLMRSALHHRDPRSGEWSPSPQTPRWTPIFANGTSAVEAGAWRRPRSGGTAVGKGRGYGTGSQRRHGGGAHMPMSRGQHRGGKATATSRRRQRRPREGHGAGSASGPSQGPRRIRQPRMLKGCREDGGQHAAANRRGRPGSKPSHGYSARVLLRTTGEAEGGRRRLRRQPVLRMPNRARSAHGRSPGARRCRQPRRPRPRATLR